ncbi:hypothetical protein [Corynebacterium tapiri]|uniref:Low molecular weight antigen MTB12-like C-terminal domain-containing protein n=1 Tax=Corynebacterium tapiri TaxID=1448266 RepID=A0A5C4U6X6_9CORY|nr:hypothetical protein [Corynebacterium tapiri]TNL99464.1 hypothetical protein FHE74_03260 [Corynebacterium tapiri]
MSAVLAAGLSLSLAACGSDDKAAESSSGAQATAPSSASEAAPSLPTAAELNQVMGVATNSGAPMEQRVATVQGGETVPPELFDTLAAAQAQSGASFQVVDPVLPGYAPNSALATVTFTLPDRAPNTAENVEFIHENGQWKLSQSWACTLITSTVAPEQVPQMCQDSAAIGGGVAPAAPAAPAPAAPGAPADPAAPAPAPAPADPAAPAAPAPAA